MDTMNAMDMVTNKEEFGSG